MSKIDRKVSHWTNSVWLPAWGLGPLVAGLACLTLGSSRSTVDAAIYTFLVPLGLFWILLIVWFLSHHVQASGWKVRGLKVCLILSLLLVWSDGVWGYGNRLLFHWNVSTDARYDLVINDWIRHRALRLPPASGFTVPGPFLPDTTGISRQSIIHVDALGFRREYRGGADHLPLHETRNVLCLGGSVMFGMTTEPVDWAIPDFLQQHLEATATGKPIRVLNAAYPGETIVRTTRNLRDVFLDYPLEAVVYCEAINLLAPGQRGFLLERASGLITWCINASVRKQARQAVVGYSADRYHAFLERMIRMCKEKHVPLVLVTFALPYRSTDPPKELAYWDRIQNGQATGFASARLVETHNDVMRALAEQHSIPMVDAAAMLSGQPEWFIDTCHLTQEGKKRIADEIGRLLFRTLSLSGSLESR